MPTDIENAARVARLKEEAENSAPTDTTAAVDSTTAAQPGPEAATAPYNQNDLPD